MKKVIIVYGEMGCGKNYWGEKLAKALKLDFFDGDTVVSPEMRERVSQFKPLTKKMITDYVDDYLLPSIITRARASTRGLVVAQALYRNVDRKVLSTYLAQEFNVKLYWVRAPLWRNIKQLFSRKNGAQWVKYFLMNKPFFQKPYREFCNNLPEGL